MYRFIFEYKSQHLPSQSSSPNVLPLACVLNPIKNIIHRLNAIPNCTYQRKFSIRSKIKSSSGRKILRSVLETRPQSERSKAEGVFSDRHYRLPPISVQYFILQCSYCLTEGRGGHCSRAPLQGGPGPPELRAPLARQLELCPREYIIVVGVVSLTPEDV